MAYKLTVTNYDRQANFKHDLLLCHCSSTHSITHSSRLQYASYGGRHCLSRMSSILQAIQSGVQAKFVDCAHVTFFSTHSKFHLFLNFTELHTLTPTARSCALLIYVIDNVSVAWDLRSITIRLWRWSLRTRMVIINHKSQTNMYYVLYSPT